MSGAATRHQGRERIDAVDQISDLLAALGNARLAVVAAGRAIRTLAPGSPAAFAAIRDLPALALEVSDAPTGHDIAAAYLGRRWGVPLNVAVPTLALPADPADYLRGRRRQAVRTNCTRARALGLRYVSPESEAQIAQVIAAVTARRQDGQDERERLSRRLVSGVGAFRYTAGEDGEPVALVQFTRDQTVARLNWSLAAPSPHASPARHLLAAELFCELSSDGVRHVITSSDLFAERGVRYFEQRLGFEPRNLRLSSQASRPGR